MNERHVKRLQIAAPWAAIVAAVGAIATWGAMQARLETLEREQAEAVNERKELIRQVQQHDRSIAVVETKLDTIIRELRDIGRKIEERRR